MKAAIYLRVSLDATGERLAVERQREDCEAIAKARGWDVVKTYEDNSVSAYSRTAKRPAYERMQADYAAGLFDALVCWDLDRLTRQPRQLEDWIEAAEDKGLALVTANGEADLTTDGGRLFARLKAAVARSEVERKGARQRRANDQRAAQGKPVAGRRPYGYQKGGIEPLEDEAKYVREAYEVVLSGGSLKGIARRWNDEGVRPPQGGDWTSTQVKKILRRERNAGRLMRHGEVQASSVIVPLIDPVKHDQAMALLNTSSHNRSGREPMKHWLTGLATCGVCGENMRGKRVSVPGEEGRHLRYICASRLERKTSGDTRRHPSITGDMLEEHVLSELASALLFHNYAGEAGESLGDLLASLDDVREKRQDILTLVSDGFVTRSEAMPRLQALKSREGSLEAEIRASQRDSGIESEVRAIRASLFATKTVSLTEAGDAKRKVIEGIRDLEPAKRRTLVEHYLSLVINPGRGVKRVTCTVREHAA